MDQGPSKDSLIRAENLTKLFQKQTTQAQNLRSILDKIASDQTRHTNAQKLMAEVLKDKQESIVELNRDLGQELINQRKASEAQALALKEGLSLETAQLTVAKQYAIKQAESLGLYAEETEELARQYDKALQKQKTLDKITEAQEAQEDLSRKLAEYDEQRQAALEGINSTSRVFKDIVTDSRLAAAVFTNQLIKGFNNTKDMVADLRDEGLTVTQAFTETGLAISDAFSFTGTSARDSIEVTKGLRSELGSVSEVTREVRLNAASLAKTYGISNEEAGQLTAQLSKLPGNSLQTANNTLEFAGSLAKAADVAPGDVMKEIAANTEATAQFSKQGGKNIAVAAVAAKKLGVEFGSIANAAESLLDFESSIEKQMEASVLLGREINLDKARQLALEGDLVGATTEMLKNVGSEAEFNKLNVIQRKALADSMGVSVSQLGSMVKNQDKLSSLTQEQQEALAGGEVSMDEILANTNGFLGKIKQSAITTISLVKGFGQLRNGVKEASEGVKAFFGGLKGGLGIVDKIKKGVGGLLGTGGDKAGAAAKQASKVPEKTGDGMGGLTKSIEKIKPAKLLAGAAALVLTAAAVFVFAKAAQEFGNVSWESVGKAVVGMLALVGALALIGAIMMSGVGAVAILAGAGAMLIMASALFVLGKAVQEIGKGFAIFTPALLELAPMAGSLLLVGASLAIVGAGLMALGAASYFAFPGLMLGGIGLMAMVPGLYLMNEIAQNNVISSLSTDLINLSASASGLGSVGSSLFGIAGGLGAMALAGFAALPIIGSLIALASVAPALGKLADVFGGGGSSEDDKLDKVVDKLDQLISVASQGGVINMDGKKVGDVLRLSVTSSGVK